MACVTACAVPAAPRKTRVCVSHKVSTKCALRLRGVGMSLSPRTRGTVVVPRVLPSTAELETAQFVSIAGFGVLIGSFAVILGLKGEPEPCPLVRATRRGGVYFLRRHRSPRVACEHLENVANQRQRGGPNAAVTPGVYRVQRRGDDLVQNLPGNGV